MSYTPVVPECGFRIILPFLFFLLLIFIFKTDEKIPKKKLILYDFFDIFFPFRFLFSSAMQAKGEEKILWYTRYDRN